jgi:A/G-specific adenine glycosylase
MPDPKLHNLCSFNKNPAFVAGFLFYNRLMPEFLRTLKNHYRRERRDLPWRKTHNPYRLLVSEVMLQQTTVERVVPYYNRFIKRFPTAGVLAGARFHDVLDYWQGLGYNRRAQYLQRAARAVVKEHKGIFPRSAEELEALPGVGRYTARSVAAFAYNSPEVFIETNIRTVFLHHFFSKRRGVVRDEEILPLIERALKRSRMRPRTFYTALMDYGAHLKKSGVRINERSAHYTRQTAFEGSARQLRGAILRELLHHQATLATLAHRIPRTREELTHELTRLTAEGLVALRGRYFSIPEK